jgi:hypothetical protein
MTDPSPFAKLAALYSRGPNNGASTNSLDLALSRVTVAEKNLEEARSTARAAARREGMRIDGLFGKCSFIRRETGERWADEAAERAHAEGKQLAYCELTKIFCDMNGVDYEDALAQAKNSMKVGVEHAERVRAEMRDVFEAAAAGKLKLAGKILRELFPDGDRRNAQLARQIIAAGARRDSDPSNERPDPTGLAKQIVNSGRRRRGEKEIK